MVATDEPGGVTPQQVKSGVLWISAISLLREGLQFGVMLVLVRLLDARAYGEFSLVSSVLGFLTVLSFRSFVEYTLQARPGEPVDYQAQFTFGSFTQLLAVVTMNAAAVALRRFPDYEAAAPALSVMSIFFVVDWAAELRVKMLERELNWTRLRLLEAGGLVGNAVVAIMLAMSGAGVYALLIPGLITALPFIYDLFFVMKWRPAWSLDWHDFQPAWRYGWTRIASGLAARGQQVLESGVMVSVIGLAALGVYGRAVGLASFSCLKLTSLLTLTIFPMLTRFEPNSAGFRRASAMLLRVTAWTSIPVAAGFSLVAPELVRVLYGGKWAAAIPFLPWALVTASLTALMEAGAFLLLTNREPAKTLAIDVVNLVGTGVCLALLLPRGIVSYMAGILVLQALLLTIALGWLVKSGAIALSGVKTAFLVPGVVVSGLVAVARLTRVGAVMLAVVFGIIYLVALRIFSRRELQELIQLVPGGRRIGQILRIRSRRASM